MYGRQRAGQAVCIVATEWVHRWRVIGWLGGWDPGICKYTEGWGELVQGGAMNMTKTGEDRPPSAEDGSRMDGPGRRANERQGGPTRTLMQPTMHWQHIGWDECFTRTALGWVARASVAGKQVCIGRPSNRATDMDQMTGLALTGTQSGAGRAARMTARRGRGMWRATLDT